MTIPNWLSEPGQDGCDHDFSIEREIPRQDLPPYVKSPVVDRYCAICGTKETLRHRLASATQESATAGDYAPPPKASAPAGLPDPIPTDQIKVTLDLEKYGKRYDIDRQRGIKDKAINVGPDPRWTDAMAAAAEEFVAKALGVHFSGAIDKPDNGWDMTLFGRRIQVKWTKYHDGKLLAHEKQTMTADAYVLVTGSTTDQFRIAGWATAKELRSAKADLGYGVSFALPQEDLRPFSSLLDIRLKGGQPSALPLRAQDQPGVLQEPVSDTE